MSYVLIDAGGDTRDFASNLGLQELRSGAGPALLRLLNAGEADESLRMEILEEEGVPEYIVEMLSELEAPLVLTSGVEESSNGN